jgi:hypothetical protein
MSISTLFRIADDIPYYISKFFGRKVPERDMHPYTTPEDLVAALHNPATEERAVARMRKMHYGSFYGKRSRGMFSSMAEKELLTKRKGFGGAIFGRPVKGLSVGLEHFKGGIKFAPLQGIFGAVTAGKGHKFSGAMGGTIRGIAFASGDLIGTLLAGPIGGFALGSAFDAVAAPVTDAIQSFVDFNKNVRHINMGGNYEDTRTAYTMRQRAAQEMGSSVMNARSYLGKEAALMHQ